MDVNRQSVLQLNSNWQAINVKSIKDAFVAMMGGDANNPPAIALDFQYAIKEDGEYDFESMPGIVPTKWIDWQALPIRDYDNVINTSRAKIRIPTVIVATNYAKLPKKSRKLNAKTLYELQKGRCGYTGEHLDFSEGNLEHIKPRSLGGKDTWENLLWVNKDINSKRGNKPLEELGLKPMFPPHKQPAPIPVPFTIKKMANYDWVWFLHKD